MKLKKFKEKNNKKVGIVIFTVTCIMLITGAIFYRTFASFEVNHNFNIINETVQEMGDLEQCH